MQEDQFRGMICLELAQPIKAEPMHLYLDHVIIAVRDLEQAIRNYQNLGFTVTAQHKMRSSSSRMVLTWSF
jgi:catechol-2,3-dioxygenase